MRASEFIEPSGGHDDEAPVPDIDIEGLRSLGRNDPLRIQRLAALFLESMDRGMAEIRNALASGDGAGLQRAGHRMKSAARSAGFPAFAELCEAMENHGRVQALGRADGTLQQMANLLRQIRNRLVEALDRDPPAPGNPAPGTRG